MIVNFYIEVGTEGDLLGQDALERMLCREGFAFYDATHSDPLTCTFDGGPKCRTLDEIEADCEGK